MEDKTAKISWNQILERKFIYNVKPEMISPFRVNFTVSVGGLIILPVTLLPWRMILHSAEAPLNSKKHGFTMHRMTSVCGQSVTARILLSPGLIFSQVLEDKSDPSKETHAFFFNIVEKKGFLFLGS